MPKKYRATILGPIEIELEELATASATPSDSPSNTPSPSPSNTPSPSPSNTPSESASVSPSNTPSPSATPAPTGNGLPAPMSAGHALLAGEYTLTGDVHQTVWFCGPDIVLNLNGHTIEADSGDGVRNYLSWADNNVLGALPQGQRPIIRGPGNIISHAGHAVGGRRAENAIIEGGVYLQNEAQDTGCIRFDYGRFSARDVTCRNLTTSTSNRHQMYATVGSGNSPFTCERVAIVGGNVGFNMASHSIVRDCFVSQDSYATNGYAAAMYRNSYCTVEGCLFIANNGRGVLVNGTDNEDNPNNHIIRNNLIFAREKPNTEFGAALTPCGIRMRYDANGSEVRNNFCLAMGGPGWTGCAGLYLSNDPGMINIIEQNRFAGFLIGEPTDNVNQFGKAVTLEAQGRLGNLCHDAIHSNVLEGNHILLSLSGSDGYDLGAHNVPMQNNIFQRRPAEDVFSDFVNMASQRFLEIAIAHPVAAARMDAMLEQLAAISSQIRTQSYDIWTDARWRTSTTITVQGSGNEPPLVVRRSAHEDHPVSITIIP